MNSVIENMILGEGQSYCNHETTSLRTKSQHDEGGRAKEGEEPGMNDTVKLLNEPKNRLPPDLIFSKVINYLYPLSHH